jgi:hypothetical protein
MPRWRPLRAFPLEFSQPLQLRAKLLNHEVDHPDSLMKAVTNLFPDRAQRFFFVLQFSLEELLPSAQLFFEDSRFRLPR